MNIGNDNNELSSVADLVPDLTPPGTNHDSPGTSPFENLISELLAAFLAPPDNEVDATIQTGIRRIVECLGLDQGLLVHCGGHASRCTVTHSWTGRGRLAAFPSEGPAPVPWIHQRTLRGRSVAVDQVGDLPPEADEDAAFLRDAGIASLVSLPLKIGAHVAGALVLVRSRRSVRWSAEVVRRLQTVADVIGAALDRSKRGARLDQRLRFDALLAEVTARFVHIPADLVDTAVEDVQRRICATLGLDRSTVYQYSSDASELVLTHLHQPPDGPQAEKRLASGAAHPVYWVRENGDSPAWQRVEVSTLFPWVFTQIDAGRTVTLADLDDLPEQAATDKAAFVRFGTQSTIIIPLTAGDDRLGCLTFASMRRPRQWSDDLVAQLKFVADVIAGALARGRSERALRVSEERFRGIATSLPGAVFQFYARDNGDRGLYYIDPQAEAVCGVKPEPLATFFDRFAACLPPEDLPRWRSSIEEAVQDVRPWEYEGRFMKPTGKEVYIRGFSQPRKVATEVVFSGMMLDVTERKRAEGALRESRATLDAIIDSTADFIWSVDSASFGILTSNRGLRDYFLHQRNIRLQPGMRPEDLFADQEYVQIWRGLYQRALREGPFSTEYPTVAGKTVLQLSLSLLKRDGEIFGVSVFGKDITEQKKAEQVLRQSEQKYRRLHESMRDAFVSVDMNGRIVEFNAAYQGMLGYSAEELRGVTYQQLTPEKWHSAEDEIIQGQVVARGYSDVYEKEYRKKDGTIFPVELRTFLIRDDAGQPAGMWAIVRDITDRKLFVETLRQRNNYIETVMERAPIGFAVHTIDDGVGRFVSTKFEEIYAVPRGTINTHTEFFDKVWPNHPELRDDIRRRVTEVLATGDPSRMVWENVPVPLPSGETRYITAKNIPLYDQNLMVSTVRDTTEQVRALAALKESEARFRQVAENVADFIWELDANGLYTYASDSVERILGYKPDEMVGKMHFYDLFAPESRDELKAAALKVFAAKESFRSFPNVNVSKHGKRVHLETSGSPMLNDAGELVGYRGADTDVSRRVQAENESRESLKEVQRLQELLHHENVELRKQVQSLQGKSPMVGRSDTFLAAVLQAEQVAATDSTVLILGETGTGKEVLAKYLHSISGRANKAFVTTNIAAIPSTLLESELFGREKGAYTGALTRQPGRFEMANGGTIFLDEIGEMPLETQAKILRVLQSGEFERLGDSRTIRVDVRVIAATNRVLPELIEKGAFRRDLFYRLNVFPITVPPLRERPADIPQLVWAFAQELSAKMGKPVGGIRKADLELLQTYDWPGNVRELRNVVERAMILTQGTELRLTLPQGERAADDGRSYRLLVDVERQHIQHVLKVTGQRVYGPGGAAKVLGLKPSTLYSLMRRLGLERASGRTESGDRR